MFLNDFPPIVVRSEFFFQVGSIDGKKRGVFERF
jgi:hypothetical protein